MLLIFPYSSATKMLYGCSTKYEMCARVAVVNDKAKIRNLVPFFESDYLLGVDNYKVELMLSRANSGYYRFRLNGGSYNLSKVSCSEAIKMIEKAFASYIITEPKPVDPFRAAELIDAAIKWRHKTYVLLPWHIWVLDNVPKGVKIRRIIISNNVVILMP